MKFLFYLVPALFFISSEAQQCPLLAEPTGLENPGNGCFINAAFQVFLSASDLATRALEINNYGTQDGLLTISRDTIHSYRLDNSKPLNPEIFQKKLWEILGVPYNTQDDSNYALTTLLENITQTDIEPAIKAALPVYNGTKCPRTDLSQLFYIESFSRMDFPDENRDRITPELSVSLELKVRENDSSLFECLDNHFKCTMMPYKIENNLPVEAPHKLYLHETQNYVVIMLNRRGQRVVEEKTEFYKNSKPISFPLSGLDVSTYFLDIAKNKGPYELIGLIMHSGSSDNGGHYIAFAKKGSRWYECNDSKIRKITQEEIVTIANQGSSDKTFVPTTFIYELSSARSSLE